LIKKENPPIKIKIREIQKKGKSANYKKRKSEKVKNPQVKKKEKSAGVSTLHG